MQWQGAIRTEFAAEAVLNGYYTVVARFMADYEQSFQGPIVAETTPAT